ncbi:peroxiredoxin [Altererythrobacter sp. Root672]|uniref:peroxiredoxin n=1 Tax=Altererythrobacter sp. Root672 TaxID=1736584 RepID=UPI0006F3394B|nr:peroxiredoxin [Altererythrobacter sp. Root672]KRA83488.1 peroxiredoxin [Altererythrobacter sp. Root672]
MTKRPMLFAAVAAAMLAAAPASATLQEGAHVPSLITQGALNGKAFSFNLQQELRKGPVVLYFFPKAFTPGCSQEAQAFAAAIGDFKAAGAQVFGMSGDSVEDLAKFSEKECAGAFPVARATPSSIQAFDVALTMNGQKNDNLTSRTSYVIAPDGKIVMVHSDMDWREHVSSTLAAVRALKG